MSNTVYFRTFEEEDAILIYQWMNDDKLKELSIGLNRRMSHEEATAWVKRRMDYDQYNAWWAICAKDTNRMIGYMSLNNIHYINRSADFGGLLIGDKDYQDGGAWIESYLFLYEYAFDRLGMNRVYGQYLADHNTTNFMGPVMFCEDEGILRQAYFKNGRFYDAKMSAILREDYYKHKANGDYEMAAIMKRIMKILKEQKNGK